mgnify:FL=1
MFICKNLSAEVPETNAFSFGLEEYHSEDSKDNLYYGYDSIINLREGNRQVLINQWSPTEFAQPKDHHGFTPIQHAANALEVYNICPYTVEWLNRQDSLKYKYIFYPFNKRDIPPVAKKDTDVCYFGGIHSEEHEKMLRVMRNFCYCYMTMTQGINERTKHYLPWATHKNLSHRDKIVQVGKCKISVCYNVVPLDPPHVQTIKNYDGWETCKAFSHLDNRILPQFKSRMHEAAMSRTLNLVYRDPWGISEDYYTPDEDFVYFDSIEDLEDKIDEILKNWKDYEGMVESAYNKALDYTTDKMFDLIKQGKSWKPKSADPVDQAI